ncbi:MAG: hypothetical protein WAL50_20890 [Kineosporiaceae bacterium]
MARARARSGLLAVGEEPDDDGDAFGAPLGLRCVALIQRRYPWR